MPAGHDLSSASTELDHWELLLEGIEGCDLPSSPASALQFANGKLCPSVEALLPLVCTWPVTTSTRERCISGLCQLKTYLRSTMGQTRLTGLALLHTHYNMKPCRDKILHVFVKKILVASSCQIFSKRINNFNCKSLNNLISFLIHIL